MLYLLGLNAYLSGEKIRKPHCEPIPLIGNFNGETEVHHHIFPLASATYSGIEETHRWSDISGEKAWICICGKQCETSPCPKVGIHLFTVTPKAFDMIKYSYYFDLLYNPYT